MKQKQTPIDLAMASCRALLVQQIELTARPRACGERLAVFHESGTTNVFLAPAGTPQVPGTDRIYAPGLWDSDADIVQKAMQMLRCRPVVKP